MVWVKSLSIGFLVAISIAVAFLFTVLVNIFNWSDLAAGGFLFAVGTVFAVSMLATSFVIGNMLKSVPSPIKAELNEKSAVVDDVTYLLDSAANYILFTDRMNSITSRWEDDEFNWMQLTSIGDDIRRVSQDLLGWWFSPVAVYQSYTTPAQRQLAQTPCEAWIDMLKLTNDPLSSDIHLLDMEDITPLTTCVSKELSQVDQSL